jgi:hypothetical protein
MTVAIKLFREMATKTSSREPSSERPGWVLSELPAIARFSFLKVVQVMLGVLSLIRLATALRGSFMFFARVLPSDYGCEDERV